MNKTVVLKNDEYRKSRGGYSRLIKLNCRKCNWLIAIYQKDGPGNIRRLYLDRIYWPKNRVNLQMKKLTEIPNLTCQSCKELIGIPFIYKKENRKAFRIFQDALTKRINKK